MKSRMIRPAVLAVLVLLLVSGSVPILAGASSAPDTRASEGYSDLVNFGTAWVPQSRSKFSAWRPMGWGIEARVKPAGVGDQWVHIPIPFMAVEEGTAVKIAYVEFCAKSSNGGFTKPIRMHLRSEDTLFGDQAVVWAANNSRQCFHIELSPAVWQQSLGVSVLVHFASTSDMMTFYKAWVRVIP
jgi:hypothetical protein